MHNESVGPLVEGWFAAAGHPGERQVGPAGRLRRLTDWAEDAYVAVNDAADGSSYLVEPWPFRRAGDALIADAVEEHTSSARRLR